MKKVFILALSMMFMLSTAPLTSYAASNSTNIHMKDGGDKDCCKKKGGKASKKCDDKSKECCKKMAATECKGHDKEACKGEKKEACKGEKKDCCKHKEEATK